MPNTHAHHAPDPRGTGPSVSIIANPRGQTEYVFVTNGIHGGEQAVPFDTVLEADDDIVLAQRTRRGHTLEVFRCEHWEQFGDVSEWLASHAEVMNA